MTEQKMLTDVVSISLTLQLLSYVCSCTHTLHILLSYRLQQNLGGLSVNAWIDALRDILLWAKVRWWGNLYSWVKCDKKRCVLTSSNGCSETHCMAGNQRWLRLHSAPSIVHKKVCRRLKLLSRLGAVRTSL